MKETTGGGAMTRTNPEECAAPRQASRALEQLRRLHERLPTVHMEVDGDIARAEASAGDLGPSWSIHAEREDPSAARTTILVDGQIVADVTIHPLSHERLSDAVQSVSSGLLWSALRAWRLRQHVADEEVDR